MLDPVSMEQLEPFLLILVAMMLLAAYACPNDDALSSKHVCRKAKNCSTSFGGALCSGYLLDVSLHATILAGACELTCNVGQPQGCAEPPATQPFIPSAATAPAPGSLGMRNYEDTSHNKWASSMHATVGGLQRMRDLVLRCACKRLLPI